MAAERKRKQARPPPGPRRTLLTPEGVDLGVDLASGSARAAAFVVDIIILVAVMVAFVLLVRLAGWASGRQEINALGVFYFLIMFLLRNAWFIGWEMRPGAATPGKRLMKIRVATRNGGRLTADAVFARNVMRELEIFMPLVFALNVLPSALGLTGVAGAWAALAGVVWSLIFLLFPLFNRDRLRAGDLIAGTWVVEAPTPRLLPDLAQGAAGTAARYAFTPEQVDAYGVMELHVLEDVIRRRDPKVMAEVARRIREKIGWSPIEHESDDEFLSAYYAALRRRLEQQLLFGRRRKDKHDKG